MSPQCIDTGTLGVVPGSREAFIILSLYTALLLVLILSSNKVNLEMGEVFLCLMSLIINLNPSQAEWVLQS